jgi:threonine dehydratase
MKKMPSLHDAFTARGRISPLVRETPLVEASELAARTGAESVHLKLECRQHTGAFKVRGAANKILSLNDEAKQQGVITFSTGNHGKAVAYVAHRAGIDAVVCLSEQVPAYRAEAIRNLGAEVAVKGRSQDEAELNYHEMLKARGLIPVVPFDDPLIIAGQGTIALEILEKLPATQVLLIQLSGGGLLAGMAMVAKSINPRIHVVGLSLEQSPAMVESLKTGRPVQVEEKHSIADSLLGGIGFDNQFTLPMVQKFADDHLLISEAEIKDGMFHLFETHRTIAEGAAAVGVGAMLNDRIDLRGKRVVALVSGGSVDSAAYLRIIRERLEKTRAPIDSL